MLDGDGRALVPVFDAEMACSGSVGSCADVVVGCGRHRTVENVVARAIKARKARDMMERDWCEVLADGNQALEIKSSKRQEDDGLPKAC